MPMWAHPDRDAFFWAHPVFGPGSPVQVVPGWYALGTRRDLGWNAIGTRGKTYKKSMRKYTKKDIQNIHHKVYQKYFKHIPKIY